MQVYNFLCKVTRVMGMVKTKMGKVTFVVIKTIRWRRTGIMAQPRHQKRMEGIQNKR